MNHAARIQIVEDQYLVAASDEACLIDAGLTCTGLASTAGMAVQMAERDRPDMILMDIRLAATSDGVGAAIEIYERFGIRSLFVSGHADAQTRHEGERAHPLGWLDKPYSNDQLLDAVNDALRALQKSEADALQQSSLP